MHDFLVKYSVLLVLCDHNSEDNIRIYTLKADGSNLIMYKTRLIWALGGKELSSYLTRTNSCSVNLWDRKDTPWSLTTVKQIEISQYPDKAAKWKKNNSYIKSFMRLLLSDSLLMKVFREATTKGIWDFLVTEFEGRSYIVILGLRHKLQLQCCQEKADLCVQFNHMFTLWEELITLSQTISDNEFSAIFLTSLPTAYNQSVSSMIMLVDTSNLTITNAKSIWVESLPVLVMTWHSQSTSAKNDLMGNAIITPN